MAFPISNLLLEKLPSESRTRLLAQSEAVPLPVRTPIFGPGEVPRYVHLLTSGIASVVTPLSGGEVVEIALVGREGFPEALHLLGPSMAVTRCFMQVPGSGIRIDYQRFQQEFYRDESIRRVVLRNVQFSASTLGQIAACNRLHNVEERLARWLLMVADRVGEDRIRLTHEFLAEMIGSRRTTVTLVARTLQRGGLIEYRRGDIRILDREGLEDVACECYAITRKLLVSLYK